MQTNKINWASEYFTLNHACIYPNNARGLMVVFDGV